MAATLTPRQHIQQPTNQVDITEVDRRFCQNIIKGMNQTQALMTARGRLAKSITPASASVRAWKIMQKPAVKSYLAQLRDTAKSKDVLSYEESLSFLASAVRTPLSKITEDSPLMQKKTVSQTKYGERISVEVVSKLQAVEINNKMQGFNYVDRNPVAQNPFFQVINVGRLAEADSVLLESQPAIDAEVMEVETSE